MMTLTPSITVTLTIGKCTAHGLAAPSVEDMATPATGIMAGPITGTFQANLLQQAGTCFSRCYCCRY